ncbi:MAG TPA: carotenoid biosynthesis protein [Sunxiuqinia sp.]|nr:carotenoid biosynthesis protein [Sunxiuqinia sp.]
MKEQPSIQRAVKIILAILYGVGMVGFSISTTYEIFVQLTPLNLLLTLIVLLWFHDNWNTKSVFLFFAVTVIGFMAELLGVNSQILFGHYEYGEALGVKIWNTPIMIGVNWLILSYCIAVFLGRFQQQWFFPFLAAAIMVGFDVVMEPVATNLRMWSWQTEQIPLKNYLDWYLVSFLIFTLIRASKVNWKNRLAAWILLVQFIFFVGLNIYFKLNEWAY